MSKTPQSVGKAGDRPIVNGEVYPRIGLALGSGASKAICQFGLIKRFHQKKIPVSYVIGSSMGAIIAGVYALGLDVDLAVEKAMRYAEATNINNLTNFNIFHESIYKKDFTDNLLKELFADFTFEECKIPLAVTAVDLESGKVVLLNKGPLVTAIRASTSIPGIFEPVLLDGKYLVDGGLLEDCPISSLRQIGDCDIIIGSFIQDEQSRQNISGYIYEKFYPHKIKTNFFQKELKRIKTDLRLLGTIILRSVDILRTELWKYRVAESKPDLLIDLNIEKVELFDYQKTKELVQMGEKAFDKNYQTLLDIIEKKKKELNG